MSQLAAYRELQRQIAELAEKQSQLEESAELKRELEFEEKVKALVAESGLTTAQVFGILCPGETFKPKTAGARTPRPTKVYKNPHTGEVIETKGGNHKGLRAWKDAHGADVVESWLV